MIFRKYEQDFGILKIRENRTVKPFVATMRFCSVFVFGGDGGIRTPVKTPLNLSAKELIFICVAFRVA